MTDSARYPIGTFQRKATFTADERADHVARLTALPAALAASISGLDDAGFETPYRDGGWTVRQVVHHVADSHINAFVRLKLALSENEPTIKPYDENAWAHQADVQAVSPLVSLAVVAGVHERLAALLRAMRPEDFARKLVHPDNGPMTIDMLIALYAWHGDHHVAHIRNARVRAT